MFINCSGLFWIPLSVVNLKWEGEGFQSSPCTLFQVLCGMEHQCCYCCVREGFVNVLSPIPPQNKLCGISPIWESQLADCFPTALLIFLKLRMPAPQKHCKNWQECLRGAVLMVHMLCYVHIDFFQWSPWDGLSWLKIKLFIILVSFK